MARGLEPSTRHEVQLLIKGASGRIQRTYGNDPRRFPG